MEDLGKLGAIVLCSLIQEYKIVKLEKNLAMLRSDDRYLQAAESAQRELHAVDDDWKFVKSHFQRVLHLRPLGNQPHSNDMSVATSIYLSTSTRPLFKFSLTSLQESLVSQHEPGQPFPNTQAYST
eukprot:1379204-Amorphochlora_amoeboformis.AAC.1